MASAPQEEAAPRKGLGREGPAPERGSGREAKPVSKADSSTMMLKLLSHLLLKASGDFSSPQAIRRCSATISCKQALCGDRVGVPGSN